MELSARAVLHSTSRVRSRNRRLFFVMSLLVFQGTFSASLIAAEITDAIVRTDPVLFGRVLRNLLQNAITHTNHGFVSVSCREQLGQLIIDVSDTGPGIPEAQHDAIFSEYYQLDTSQRQSIGGMGLGLAIVKKMATLLQIGIKLQSVIGQGSTFSVNVPLGDRTDDVHSSPPSHYQSLSGNRILFSIVVFWQLS